jgi:endonuclease/exonuclease/phosphatase family metal-dependent hydrolase
VAELADAGHWLKVAFANGKTGWVVEQYVDRVLPPPSTAPNPEDERTVWGSAQGCREVVVAGRRAAATRPDVVRIATWNIRWFPQETTDVEWVACTIAWLNVEVLSVNEITDTDTARTAIARVMLLLESFTQAPWRVDLQECGGPTAQHVGFLWNTGRVTLSDHRDMWQFNARATATSSPCAGRLRPGRYARVQAVGGGVTFHAISVHTKSSATAEARAERLAVLSRLSAAAEDLRQADEDIIILGDFNTMGDSTPGSAEAEIQGLFTVAGTQPPGFVRLTVTPSCSGTSGAGRAGSTMCW